jgi:hypothetical protein
VQENVRKESVSEDSRMLCPDCREPMTQVLMHATHTLKWECRCAPGIQYCE